MFSDIVEDEQKKTETRSEALVFSANNFLNKLVGNIGILGSGVMITGLVLILLKLLQRKSSQPHTWFNIYFIRLNFRLTCHLNNLKISNYTLNTPKSFRRPWIQSN